MTDQEIVVQCKLPSTPELVALMGNEELTKSFSLLQDAENFITEQSTKYGFKAFEHYDWREQKFTPGLGLKDTGRTSENQYVRKTYPGIKIVKHNSLLDEHCDECENATAMFIINLSVPKIKETITGYICKPCFDKVIYPIVKRGRYADRQYSKTVHQYRKP